MFHSSSSRACFAVRYAPCLLLGSECHTMQTVQRYCSQRWRETSEEKRAQARLQDQMINEVRQAAEVHRQARQLSLELSLHPSFMTLQPVVQPPAL